MYMKRESPWIETGIMCSVMRKEESCGERMPFCNPFSFHTVLFLLFLWAQWFINMKLFLCILKPWLVLLIMKWALTGGLALDRVHFTFTSCPVQFFSQRHCHQRLKFISSFSFVRQVPKEDVWKHHDPTPVTGIIWPENSKSDRSLEYLS